jgi:hypothetical protein
MSTPKLEIARTSWQGKPAVELIVRNSAAVPGFSEICDLLLIETVPAIANKRARVFTDAVAFEKTRKALSTLFDSKGEWKASPDQVAKIEADPSFWCAQMILGLF